MEHLPPEDIKNVLQAVQSFWPKQKVFLLTGATGFFGRWLVESIASLEEKLNSQNHFIVLSRRQPADLKRQIPVLRQSCFRIQTQDLQNEFQIDKPVDYVIHGAADVTAVKAKVSTDFSSPVTSTRNLLSAIEHSGTSNLIKFLFISSGGVYENKNDHPSREDDVSLINASAAKGQLSSYASAKLESELLVQEWAKKENCNYVAARCFSFVGPYAADQMAVMDMLNRKIRGDAIEVRTPAACRSYMYPSDLCQALFTLLLRPTQEKVYNVGSPKKITLRELGDVVSKMEPRQELRISETKGDVSLAGQFYYPDMSRYENEFGSAIHTELQSALHKTFIFLQKQTATQDRAL